MTAAAALGAVAIVAAVAVAATSSTPPRTSRLLVAAPEADRGPIPTPLATALVSPSGPWATVAMGRLGDPAGTFWQLLHQPAAGGLWSDDVEATAVATNGGIELASSGPVTSAATGPGAHSWLLVAVVPSGLLRFTPLLTSTTGGARWESGLVDAELAAHPAAVAVGPGGSASVITGSAPVAVESSAAGLTGWRTVVTLAALSRLPGARRCDPAALTAVGTLGGRLVVGTACRHGDGALFVGPSTAAGTWRRLAPLAPPAPGSGPGAVVSLQPTPSGLVAVTAWHVRGALEVSVAGVATAGTTVGPTWRLPSGARLVSVSTTPDGSALVLTSSRGRLALGQARPGGAAWQTLPTPPAATATVVPSQPPQALVVHGQQLAVDVLTGTPGGPRTWQEGQTLTVAVPRRAGEHP